MANMPCGTSFGEQGIHVCGRPPGHDGPHAIAPAHGDAPVCDHRDEHGAMQLYYLHQGARCMRCGAFVI